MAELTEEEKTKLLEAEAAKKLADEKSKQEAEAAKKLAEEKKKGERTKDTLKSTDTVIISFENPVIKSDEVENKVETETVKQHVKFLFWQSLKKNDKGAPIHSTLRGAKLVGYINSGEEVLFK